MRTGRPPKLDLQQKNALLTAKYAVNPCKTFLAVSRPLDGPLIPGYNCFQTKKIQENWSSQIRSFPNAHSLAIVFCLLTNQLLQLACGFSEGRKSVWFYCVSTWIPKTMSPTIFLSVNRFLIFLPLPM